MVFSEGRHDRPFSITALQAKRRERKWKEKRVLDVKNLNHLMNILKTVTQKMDTKVVVKRVYFMQEN